MRLSVLHDIIAGLPPKSIAWLDEPPASRLGVACGLLTFVVPIVLYLCTAMREPGGFADYTEMLIVGKVWGIPHPPGFPLYILLNGVLSAIPAGSQAFRVALISVVAGALVSHFIYRIGRQIGFGILIAASGALLVATGRSLWMQGVITDVYSLNMLLLMVTVWGLFRWRSSENIRMLYLAIWMFILGVANYPALAVALPGLLIFVLLVKPKVFLEKTVWYHALGVLMLSVVLYSYIFIRSMSIPIFSVEWIDGDWGRFWHYISCAQYDHFFGLKPDYTSNLWSMFVGIGILTLSKPGWFASFLGIYTMAGIGNRAVPLILIPTGFFLQTWFYHSHEPESRISPIYPFATLLAISFAIWLIDRVVKRVNRGRDLEVRWVRYLRSSAYVLLVLAMVAGITIHVRQNMVDLNYAGPSEDYRKVCRIMSSVEKPCIVVMTDYQLAVGYAYNMCNDPDITLESRPVITEEHPGIKPWAVMYPWNSELVTEALEMGNNLYVIDRYMRLLEDQFDFTPVDTGTDRIELFKVTLKE